MVAQVSLLISENLAKQISIQLSAWLIAAMGKGQNMCNYDNGELYQWCVWHNQYKFTLDDIK